MEIHRQQPKQRGKIHQYLRSSMTASIFSTCLCRNQYKLV